MMFRLLFFIYAAPFLVSDVFAGKLLISMDMSQTDHLKAYGVAFSELKRGNDVEWLLNFQGGAFLINSSGIVEDECRVKGVQFKPVSANEIGNIYSLMQQNNMDVVKLEKAPEIAIYTPPNKQPWDDAVTLALNYAEIPYTTLWDKEVLWGELQKYDWLHLHHEDFTGQYGKFYRIYRNAKWYKDQKKVFEKMARELGYDNVSNEKKAVALMIKEYVIQGGFIFAMCSACDSYDIAIAAEGVDIVDIPFDNSPAEKGYQSKLDYQKCFAFTDFTLIVDPFIYEYSDIDITSQVTRSIKGAEADYFTLFDFSAKYDPVPTMLTQNHVSVINGFLGQTTGFKRALIKKSVIIMGEKEGSNEVKYIHGNVGKGTFTFYGGHDPEDYQHLVGDPPTRLSLYKNSPGYRLILNNVLFPAAKKKKRKT